VTDGSSVDGRSHCDRLPPGVRRGGRELLAVLLVATLLAVALTFPFAINMAHVGRVDNFDGRWGMWSVTWVARTLVVDPRHVLNANIFFPHKRTLFYSETNLGSGVLAIPVYWATRNPYLTFNFLSLLSMVLSATGGYYLVRYLVRDRHAAAVSGIAFGFCAYVFSQTPQIHLLMTADLPFVMLAFHRVADRPTNGRAIILGLVMAAQVAFCGYYAVFAMLMVGFATVTVAATRRWWTHTLYWKSIALAACVSIIIALPVLLLYLQFQRVTGFERTLSEAVKFSADWQAYFASSALAHRWMLRYLGHWNAVLFPGFVAMIGGAAGVAIGVRTPRLREVAVLYGALGGIACWASFGPAAGLYTLLYRLIPPVTLMRAPSRFGIVVTLALAILAGIAVRHWLARVRYPTVVGLGLALLTAGELAIPLRFQEVRPESDVYTVLAKQPVGPVIELPFYSDRGMFRHARYMLASTTHWMPLINGYSDYMPPDFVEAAPTLRLFPSREAFGRLTDKQPRYAIFHLDLYRKDDREDTLARIQEFAPFLRLLSVDGDVRLYQIVGQP
jgi:hypothetical protein